jgi:hypothetical protein
MPLLGSCSVIIDKDLQPGKGASVILSAVKNLFSVLSEILRCAQGDKEGVRNLGQKMLDR